MMSSQGRRHRRQKTKIACLFSKRACLYYIMSPCTNTTQSRVTPSGFRIYTSSQFSPQSSPKGFPPHFPTPLAANSPAARYPARRKTLANPTQRLNQASEVFIAPPISTDSRCPARAWRLEMFGLFANQANAPQRL